MSHMAYSSYFGAFVMLILTFCIFWLITTLSAMVGNRLADKKYERLKTDIYESGPVSIRQPNKINSHFFLIGMLFILFDVEIIFMFPWAVNFKILGMFGLIEMILFITILVIGLIYAWSKGALDWQRVK